MEEEGIEIGGTSHKKSWLRVCTVYGEVLSSNLS